MIYVPCGGCCWRSEGSNRNRIARRWPQPATDQPLEVRSGQLYTMIGCMDDWCCLAESSLPAVFSYSNHVEKPHYMRVFDTHPLDSARAEAYYRWSSH